MRQLPARAQEGGIDPDPGGQPKEPERRKTVRRLSMRTAFFRPGRQAPVPWSFDACLKPPASCPQSARIRPARSQPARSQPAFRAAGPPAGPSSLTRMMDAVQWAFSNLRSSTETYGMCRPTSIRIAFAMAARPLVIRVNTRSGSHVSSGYRGLWRAIFAGRVTARNPLRLMQMMPLRTRRSSTSGRSWRLAKQGTCPAICTAVCQKRPRFRRAPDPL